MSGFPIEKAKEAMKLSLDGLYPEDTFNLITFAGDTHVLFETPVPATQANLELAQEFLASRSGGGGTEMMKAIKTALDPSDSKEHLRIVCFMTDAYVGNEDEIVAEIQRHPQARVFSFGIGSSVNRALLDKMAEAGKGEVEYVALEDDGSKAAKRFYERVRSPLLTDLSIEWNGLPVADVYPSKLTDLFSAKPVVVKGRYTKGARGSIKLKGKIAGLPYERSIDVDLPEAEAANDSLASLWARQRIDELSSDALSSAAPAKINKQITDLGIEFGLMTQFTSFVAVEEKIVNQNGKPVKVEVPVEAPAGVDMSKAGGNYGDPNSNYVGLSTGAGGGGGGGAQLMPMSATVSVTGKAKSVRPAKMKSGSGSGNGVGFGTGSGYGGGSGSGNGNGRGYGTAPPPPPSAPTREQIRERVPKQKLHTWLYAVVERVEKKTSPTPNESTFVRDGKASVEIVFTSAVAPSVLEKLKALGVEVGKTDGKSVVGSISIEKLRELAEIDEVKYVMPRML
jgi:hypothetical protein